MTVVDRCTRPGFKADSSYSVTACRRVSKGVHDDREGIFFSDTNTSEAAMHASRKNTKI